MSRKRVRCAHILTKAQKTITMIESLKARLDKRASISTSMSRLWWMTSCATVPMLKLPYKTLYTGAQEVTYLTASVVASRRVMGESFRIFGPLWHARGHYKYPASTAENVRLHAYHTHPPRQT